MLTKAGRGEDRTTGLQTQSGLTGRRFGEGVYYRRIALGLCPSTAGPPPRVEGGNGHPHG